VDNLTLLPYQKVILDFDIENMPLTYYAPDYPTAAITAIASAFIVKGKPVNMHVCLLGEESAEEMLQHFLDRYEVADMVVGHYIRKHDLPHLNAAMAEFGMGPLSSKLVSDTKEDLVKWKGLPKNQEYLSALMKVKQQKVAMTQADWREANRLTPEGLAKTRKRVESDVRGNVQMREALIKMGLLKAPRIWRP
jgi:hypothetical protein